MWKTSRLSILTVLAFTVFGCRANAGPEAAPDPRPELAASTAPEAAPAPAQRTPAPPANDSRPLLVCFGDSLTAGFGTDPGQSYPDYLQTDLDKLHYKFRVVNKGVSGDTTKDGVERLPAILALHPAIVIVEFGGNDGLRGLRNEDTRANLDKIVGVLKNSGADVVLAGITLPPDYGPDYIKQFDDTYILLAKKYRIPMLPFLLKNVYGVPGLMQADNTHATAKGNQIVAHNIMPLVLPLLRK